MKRFFKVGLIAFMLALCIVAVTACDKETDKPSIGAVNVPDKAFIVGSELDLSGGTFVFSNGKEQQNISLTAEGVAISGYDKNTAGEQTLTLTYSGVSTTFKITLVQRMTVQPTVTEYIVGEQFDNTGRLTVKQDDGEDLNLFLNNSKLTFSGFNSSTAGVKTVNVTYKDGDIEYSGSFDVTVYEAATARLNFPTKRTYKSHEELDITGGYIILSANAASGTINKVITLEESMVSGFDTSVVTDDKPTVTQTINVAYPGKNLSYTVSITLSDVTRIKRSAAALANWQSANTPEQIQKQTKMSLDAANLFLSLKEEDFEFISTEEIYAIARPATYYGSALWTAEAEQFADLFTVSGNTLSINCQTYEKAKTALAAISELDKKTSAMYLYGEALLLFAETMADDVVTGEDTFGKYLDGVCQPSQIDDAVKKVDLMLKMHEAIADIPADWQPKDLMTDPNAQKIEDAHALTVKLGGLTEPIFERYIYNTVSSWRAGDKDDYFDILYRYYYTNYVNGDEETKLKSVEAIENMIDICMPGILETMYQQYINVLIQEIQISYSQQEPAQNMDTFAVVVAFRELVKIRDQVLATDDDMISTLYHEFTLENIISQAETGQLGMFGIFGEAVGNPVLEELWTKYIDAIAAYAEQVQNQTQGAGALIEDLFASFIAATPELQYQFLASVNAYHIPELFPDDGTERMPLFASMLFAYYMDTLPEELFLQGENGGIVVRLFDALQYYMYRNEQIEDDPDMFMDMFLEAMSEVETQYSQLSNANKTLFDEHIGFFYEKYMYIYKLYDANGKFIAKDISQEWQDKITELGNMYNLFGALTMVALKNGDITKYPIAISAFEYMNNLYNSIMAEAPEDVRNMLIYANSDLFPDMQASLETMLYQYRAYYRDMLASYAVDEENMMLAWSVYQNSGMKDFVGSLIEFYAASVVDSSELTLDMVKAAMAGFLELNDDDKYLFVAMDGYGEFAYFAALRTFFGTAFSTANDALDIAYDLLDLEIAQATTLSDEAFITEWESIAEKYAALSEADKQLIDSQLGEVYSYYASLYDTLKNPQQA